METRDISIVVTGSFNNAVELVGKDTDFLADANYDELADAIAELAEAIIERKLSSLNKHGAVASGSGNAKSSSRRSSGSKTRTSSRSGSSKPKAKRQPPGRSGSDGPTEKQADLYARVYDALAEADIDVSDYPTVDELTFDEAKQYIGELMDLAKEDDIEF